MDILRSADETHGRHAVAAGVHGFFGGGRKAGAVGKAKVVVGTEIKGFAAVLKGYFRALGAGNVSFIFVKTCILDGLKLILKIFLKFSVHNNYMVLQFQI